MNKYFNKSVVLRKFKEKLHFNKFGILPNESIAKTFSKKLDLNKYNDIRKIEVKQNESTNSYMGFSQ